MIDVRAVSNEAFDFTFATTPSNPSATVQIEALYGIDGVDTGADTSGTALVFPVSMVEGAPGVYSTPIILSSAGAFWARFSVDGTEVGVSLVRVATRDFPASDARAGTAHTVGAVLPASPASVTVSMFDKSGASVGDQPDTTPYVWPQPMVQVPGRSDSWYFQDVVFDESARVQVVVAPSAGSILNDVLVVDQAPQTITLAQLSGWQPDAAYVPDDWCTIGYIRRWTKWSQALVGDADLRELRRHAIETFIGETNMWAPGWQGTFVDLVGQGSRLYLPVPIILPSDGGIEPVVKYVEPWGDQDELLDIDNQNLEFAVRGSRGWKQPYINYRSNRWDHTVNVKITATWGVVNVNGASDAIPLELQQCLVGLIRWLSLGFGVGPDDSADQNRLNRASSESTRDARIAYHDQATGMGLTGDRQVDRLLTKWTIHPGPWARRGGDLPVRTDLTVFGGRTSR